MLILIRVFKLVLSAKIEKLRMDYFNLPRCILKRADNCEEACETFSSYHSQCPYLMFLFQNNVVIIKCYYKMENDREKVL